MNVLLADHHPVFRHGLTTMMEGQDGFHFNGFVDNGSQLIEAVKNQKPDVVILEIDLPNANGVGSLRQIKSHFPELKTLVVSCHPEEIYAISSIKAGANGYIAKTRSVEEVREALITVGRGGTFLSENIKGLLEDKERKNDVLKFKKLSTREIEVLNLLARGKRNKEIAQGLQSMKRPSVHIRHDFLKNLMLII